MCGRYALGVRLAHIRQRLQQNGNRVDEAPDDDDVRENYNFPPGSYGAVYRADVPDRGAGHEQDAGGEASSQQHREDETEQNKDGKEVKYKLQSMKWGLIPFWTKRSPNYGSLLKTINCRDDSLIEDRGMWNSMKKKKRCVVICQGFYEWLKKGPGGKEKVPHYVRRKDGELMCFAGLWDCVKFQDPEEKLYTYTVITTSSNPMLSFLHDRMPVILDMGSQEMATWLDPHRTTWSKELQSLLKPYEGELECYPVSKEVGKVGNNSPTFIVPVNSKENKNNIANFFSGAGGKKAEDSKPSKPTEAIEEKPKIEEDSIAADERKGDKLLTKASDEIDQPKTEEHKDITPSQGVKREHSSDAENERNVQRRIGDDQVSAKMRSSPEKKYNLRATTKPVAATGKKMRSSTSNNTTTKKPANGSKAKDGSQRITSFFKS